MIEFRECCINQHRHGPVHQVYEQYYAPSFTVHITDLDNFLLCAGHH